MNNAFISTPNVTKFQKICEELENPMSLIGPSLAMITGPAGRGKSEAAKHYATHSSAIYIPPMNTRTPTMVMREIAFELANLRPGRSDACEQIIADAMRKERRLVMVDEADLLKMEILEMLRNINERYACPIVLIGEDELKGKVESRRRLSSRIRRRMEFAPVSPQDVAFFIQKSLNLKISADVSAVIHKDSKGDWRPVLTTAIGIERAMKASGIAECTVELASDVIKNKNA